MKVGKVAFWLLLKHYIKAHFSKRGISNEKGGKKHTPEQLELGQLSLNILAPLPNKKQTLSSQVLLKKKLFTLLYGS